MEQSGLPDALSDDYLRRFFSELTGARTCRWASSVPLIGLSSKNCTVFRMICVAKRNGINVDLSDRAEMPPLKTRN